MEEESSKQIEIGKYTLVFLLILTAIANIYWVWWEIFVDIPTWPSESVWNWAIPIFVIIPFFFVCVLLVSAYFVYQQRKWSVPLTLIIILVSSYHVWFKFWGDYRDFLWVKLYLLCSAIIIIWIIFVYPRFIHLKDNESVD